MKARIISLIKFLSNNTIYSWSIKLIFFILFTNQVYSQSSTEYGLKLGMNYAVNRIPASISGLVAGGFVSIKLSYLFAIQSEILYSMKGLSGSDQFGNYKQKLGYVEIPILLKLYIPFIQQLNPNLHFGPGISINVNDSFEQTSTNSTIIHLPPKVEPIDVILVFGAGGEIKINKIELGFELRYTIGFNYYKRFEVFPYLSNETPGGWETISKIFAFIASIYL